MQRNKQAKHLHITLTYKIMIAMVLTISVIVISLSLFVDQKTSEVYNENLSDIYNRMTEQFADNVRYKYNTYYSILANMASVSKVTTLLELDYEQNYNEVHRLSHEISSDIDKLLDSNSKNGEIMNMMVYSYKADFPVISKNVVSVKDSYYYFKYPTPEQLTRTPYFVYTNTMSVDILTLTIPVYKIMRNYSDIIGVIVMEIDANRFFSGQQAIYEKHASSVNIKVSDKDSGLWHNMESSLPEPKNTVINATAVARMQGFSWTVEAEFTPKADNRIRNNRVNLMLMSLSLIVATLAISYLLSKRFTRNLDRLIDKINQAESGSFNLEDQIESGDEIAIIDRKFSNMLTTLDTYFKENYVLKLAQQEAQLNILQNQINPHFLYNTLETIDAMACVKGYFEISEACNRLGAIFRYNITKNSTPYSTLQGEINHVKNYVAIQKMRFGSRFEVCYDIDENATTTPMLKFILQPLVENAILHALEDKFDGGSLCIGVKKIGAYLQIEIRDNGKGFDPNILSEVNTIIHNKADDSTVIAGIGLTNVINRVKLVYGSEAVIEITSEPEIGSEIRLRLPPISPSSQA